MTVKRASIALAFVSTLSTLAAGTAPANAITLMDLIRGGQSKREPMADNSLPGVTTGQQRVQQREIDPQPLPKVSGP